MVLRSSLTIYNRVMLYIRTK